MTPDVLGSVKELIAKIYLIRRQLERRSQPFAWVKTVERSSQKRSASAQPLPNRDT
jgi:hypothetical protein